MTKQTISIVITAVIFFGLGYVFSMGGIMVPKTSNIQDNTFQAGWDAAKKRLAETGFASMLGGENMEIKSVSGSVQEIKDDNIVLKIQPLEPLADPELDIRIVEIGNADLYKLVEKDQKQFQEEMEEFDKEIQRQSDNPEAATELISPPELFLKQKIGLDEIKVDQQIIVTAEEDIKDKKEFRAIEIIAQFMPSAPSAL